MCAITQSVFIDSPARARARVRLFTFNHASNSITRGKRLMPRARSRLNRAYIIHNRAADYISQRESNTSLNFPLNDHPLLRCTPNKKPPRRNHFDSTARNNTKKGNLRRQASSSGSSPADIIHVRAIIFLIVLALS